MHVSKIRKKLGDSDSGVDHIKTVRGVGYIFTRPQEPVTEKAAPAKVVAERSPLDKSRSGVS
jgi:DNA-binding winged helix-turn-helix (wHTH) protein